MAVGTAQLLSTTEMLSITNGLGNAHSLVDAARGTGYTWAKTVLGRVVGEVGTSYGVADKYKHGQLDSGAQSFYDSFEEDGFWNGACTTLLGGLANNCQVYGLHLSTTITDLDTFATYHNAQNAFSMTFCSAFARLYYLWKARASMLTAGNVVSPSVNLGAGTVSDATTVVFTNGAAVVTVSTVASGVQGYCADTFYLSVTSGTFGGTCVATGLNQSGTSAQWRAIGTAVTTGGTVAFTPVVTGHRTTDLTGLSVSAGTVCTFDLKTTGRDTAT